MIQNLQLALPTPTQVSLPVHFDNGTNGWRLVTIVAENAVKNFTSIEILSLQCLSSREPQNVKMALLEIKANAFSGCVNIGRIPRAPQTPLQIAVMCVLLTRAV